MKKSYLLIITILSINFLFAQDDDSYVSDDSDSEVTSGDEIYKGGFDWSKVTIGGGLGMQFGTVTIIEVAPTLGYYLTENVLVGVGVNYMYYENKFYNYRTSIYGGRVFGQYLFTNMPLLAHVESEIINIEEDLNKRINIVNLYVGGGLKQQMGDRSYFYILGLWNLNETKESLYYNPTNPIIRIGVALGL